MEFHRRIAYAIVVAACVELHHARQILAVEESTSEKRPTVQIEFKHDGGQESTQGEILVKYADGSLLLLTPDGQLWTLRPEDIIASEPIEEEMHVLSSEEIYEQFKQQLPPGFSIHKTRHYVLVHNTSDIYVKWVGELFENIYRKSYNYWKSKGIRLSEPRFPLVAVIFNDKQSYLSYAERDIGESAKSMIGYYNMKTNRMTTYDLTGVGGLVPAGTRIPNAQVIREILSRPQAERTVATIVHEAVHQLAFNSGLQVRLADNPLWLSEGIAMFFEAPDGSNRGWGTVGNLNQHNLWLFAQYVPKRPADSLLTLITDDSRFRSAATAGQAYPESWALTYYLLNTKSKQFASYIQDLAKLSPLDEVSPRERVDVFKEHFGEDLDAFDRDFLDYYRRGR
jgi:hypothetical protein